MSTSVKRAVVLAAGVGSKMWPYGLTQAKAALPVGGKPLLCHTLNVLERVGVQEVGIVCGYLEHQLRQAVSERGGGPLPAVSWIAQPAPDGTAAALERGIQAFPDGGDTLVIFGDVLVFETDIARLIDHHRKRGAGVSALVAPLGFDPPNDWVGVRVENETITGVWGHPRDGVGHRLAGVFVVSDTIRPFLRATAEYGTPVQVGVMPTGERDVSTTLQMMLTAGQEIAALESSLPTVDLDKPWHLLEGNQVYVRETAGRLNATSLAEGAYVDPAAKIEGYVRLGRGSRIEGPCIIKGNVIVGEESVIRDGAIIRGDAIIGDRCSIANYCLIEGLSVIGDRCVVDHAAEFGGVLMENVYLYHYMEIAGIVGRSTDIGAGSVCGTLRFDDGVTAHRVKGRTERPRLGANVAYIGDFCRLGVNAILMPGVKIGPFSLIGPGVILQGDVPERTRVMVEQQHVKSPWGPERYGW